MRPSIVPSEVKSTEAPLSMNVVATKENKAFITTTAAPEQFYVTVQDVDQTVLAEVHTLSLAEAMVTTETASITATTTILEDAREEGANHTGDSGRMTTVEPVSVTTVADTNVTREGARDRVGRW